MAAKKRKKRRQQNDRLVLKLLILVAVVLVLFEGRLIFTMFTHRSGQTVTASKGDSGTGTGETEPESAATGTAPGGSADSADFALAGLSAAILEGGTDVRAPQADPNRVSEQIDSPAVVREAAVPVDDSFFANAVFIGDSRMQGFQNASGITQGTFLTSVGLSTDAMSSQTIATPDGNISVYQGLSGHQYDKIYLMLGTNDLGYYPWESFRPNFEEVIRQFHKLQPDAVIYICSVIYLEEAKTSTSYNTNENVRKINGYLLEVCEALDYCYYINLNEIFSNGYGSLLEGASEDGIHLQPKYCEQMLTFLKNHYVEEPSSPEETEGTETETESETATESAAA